jgi:hypothetical protein
MLTEAYEPDRLVGRGEPQPEQLNPEAAGYGNIEIAGLLGLTPNVNVAHTGFAIASDSPMPRHGCINQTSCND